MTAKSDREVPDLLVRIQYILGFSAAMPGFGAILVMCITYIFQFEKIANFEEKRQCPGVTSFVPPISYHIGIWEPQRFIWVGVIYAHLPPRLLMIVLYRHSYYELRSRTAWHRLAINLYTFFLCSEPFGLVLITMVTVNDNFSIHVVAFAMWLTSFNFNMIFNTGLMYLKGIDEHKRIFKLKLFMMISGNIMSASAGCLYCLFYFFCSRTAYLSFSAVEYLMVAYNPIFYCIAAWEFPTTMFGFRILTSKAVLTINKIQPIQETVPKKQESNAITQVN